MKRLVFFMILFIATFTLTACNTNDSPDKRKDDKEDDNQTELLELTIEELAMYNGEDGKDAYIAVDGVIYDVTGVSAWTSGSHNGGMVGMDITDLIDGAPHGENVLDNLEVVGNIIE